MSRKKRDCSVDLTVPYEMMNYKWYLMVFGQFKLVLLGIRWYMVSKGLVCLYILEKVEIWSGDTDASQTDRQTTEYSATQLVSSIKHKLSHANSSERHQSLRHCRPEQGEHSQTQPRQDILLRGLGGRLLPRSRKPRPRIHSCGRPCRWSSGYARRARRL